MLNITEIAITCLFLCNETSTVLEQSGWTSTDSIATYDNRTSLQQDAIRKEVNLNVSIEEVDPDEAPISQAAYDYVYVAIAVVGILGNGLVVIVFLRNRKIMMSPAREIITNQSIIDCLASIAVISYWVTGGNTSVPPGVNFPVYCKIWISGYVQWSLFTSSTLNLTLLTLERYFRVVQPLAHRSKFNRSKILVALILVWILGFAIIILRAFLWEVEQDGTCAIRFNFKKLLAFRITIFLFTYFIPIAIMFFSYFGMMKEISSSDKFRSLLSANAAIESRLSRRRWIPLARVLTYIVLAYVICWTPLHIFYWMYIFGSNFDFSSFYYNLIDKYLLILNCCFNFFAYAFNLPRFRNEICKVFCPSLFLIKRKKEQSYDIKTLTSKF